MTVRVRALSAAVLRAAFVAAVLAIMAGILGMHVMTADHSSHAGHAGTVKAQAAHAAVGHSHAGHTAGDAAVGHSHPGHTAGDTVVARPAGHAVVAHPDAGQAPASAAGLLAASAAFSAAESCGSGCPGAQEAGAPCIPLAKTASLAVVPPPAGAAGPAPAARIRDAVGYSYVPSSPTPCDLSISRT